MPNPPKIPEPKTLVVDKFNGNLTRFRDGDINSGKANYYTSWGYDAFNYSGTLAFSQAPYDITGGIITDLIMAGKVRVESGITYLYAIGHNRRLYKIQVNKPSTGNPDYDTPVLLATLANSQTFQFGGSLDFYQGSGTEKIWIGHDTGITKINFDGTGETNLVGGSWITNVPRQQIQFVGKIFFTNGSNLASVDATETVTSYTVLSPGFPANTQARDIDVTSDGRYVVITVTRAQVGNLTGVAPTSNDIAAQSSTIVYWNGTDSAPSSSTTFPSFSMNSYHTFSSSEYIFGTQVGGAMLSSPRKVLFVLGFETPPLPNAIASSGDFVAWVSTFWDINSGKLKAAMDYYGTIDADTPIGLYRQMIMPSTLTNGDVIRIPFFSAITVFSQAGLTGGYSNTFELMGTGKSYFSTLEYNGSTTKYGFYAYKNVIDTINSCNTGVYETQHQVFSKKVKPTEVRVYMEPAGAAAPAVSFLVDLIGIDGTVISGGSYTFNNTNAITATETRLKYNPATAPTAVIGLRITNIGTLTPLIHKVEIDYVEAGN